jgi:hypothetical protein
MLNNTLAQAGAGGLASGPAAVGLTDHSDVKRQLSSAVSRRRASTVGGVVISGALVLRGQP